MRAVHGFAALLMLVAGPGFGAEAEVGADEYRVYADFLRGGGPADASAYPPDFADIWRARDVDRRTGTRTLDAGALRTIHRELGDIDPVTVEDYRARSLLPAAMPTRLSEAGVRVVADDAELPGIEPRLRSGLSFGTLRFSRVGFNAAGERALFHVFLVGGGPSLGYFVAMALVDGKWIVRGAALTDYRIH